MPDHAQDETGTRESEPRGQTRESISAPADFFAGLSGGGKRDGEEDHEPRLVPKARPGGCHHTVCERDSKFDRGHVAYSEQIPLRRSLPVEQPPQYGPNTRCSLVAGSESECNQGRSECSKVQQEQ